MAADLALMAVMRDTRALCLARAATIKTIESFLFMAPARPHRSEFLTAHITLMIGHAHVLRAWIPGAVLAPCPAARHLQSASLCRQTTGACLLQGSGSHMESAHHQLRDSRLGSLLLQDLTMILLRVHPIIPGAVAAL